MRGDYYLWPGDGSEDGTHGPVGDGRDPAGAGGCPARRAKHRLADQG